MERFVQLIVGGGITLLAGLWALTLSEPWSVPWSLGLLAALLGTAALGGGIRSALDYPNGEPR